MVCVAVSGAPLSETGAGWSQRSAQCVHLWISGLSESQSAVGTPQGQAHTQ